MTLRFIATRPSALLPLVMSLAALGVVLIALMVGVQPQPDEGVYARVWQLLIAGQLPIIAWFGLRWLPRAPREGTLLIALQLAAALVTMTPVLVLGW